MEEEKNIELAESYLLHRMTDEEAAAFEQILLIDPEMEHRVETLRSLLAVLKEKDREQLQQRLKIKEAGFRSGKFKKTSTSRIHFFKLAAAVVILIAVFSILFTSFYREKNNVEELTQKYKPIEPGLPVLMDNSDSRQFSDAMSLFQDAKFKESLAVFDPMLAENPTNDTLLFYVSLCNFELENYAVAQNKLEMVLSCENSVWVEKSEWWLALSFLSQNEKAKSRLLLQKIEAEKGHLFNEKAGQLLVEDYFLSN